MARNTSQKANMLMSLSSLLRTFEARELLEGQLVNKALSQRLTTEAEDQQAARKSTAPRAAVRTCAFCDVHTVYARAVE